MIDTNVIVRSARDDDWPDIVLLAATGFGVAAPAEDLAACRSMLAADGAVVACDGPCVVGMALILDLRLTVPGGATVPTAGVAWVVVAPTHRRRGLLRRLLAALAQRMAAARYPLAALTASEGGIYGRFGYGPATVTHHWCVDRRAARFRAGVPDPGGVRIVDPSMRRDDIADIAERSRLATPGGLHRPRVLWDELFADRESGRGGGSPLFCLLHLDGFALYRTHGGEDDKRAVVDELVTVSAEAHIALWRALLGLDAVDTVSAVTHPGDVLPYLLTDPRRVGTTAVGDDVWLRLLDVPEALQARSYAVDVDVCLDVTDDVGAAGGRFALTIRGGVATCAATDAPPQLRVDLAALGSVYLGGHRFGSLAAAHRVEGGDAQLIRLLDAAFAAEVPAQLSYGF